MIYHKTRTQSSDTQDTSLTEKVGTVSSKNKWAKVCLVVLNISVSLLIPVCLTLSDLVKKQDLYNNLRDYSRKDLLTVGILDMMLFCFILVELVVAFGVFACLSKKFGVKFDTKQVLIHMSVIISISISRVTGFLSEAQSVALAHDFSDHEVKVNNLRYPVGKMSSMLSLWSISDISFAVYFVFLVWLLLIIEGSSKKKITKNKRKEKEENDKNYVMQRLKTMLQEDKQSAMIIPTSPGALTTEIDEYD